MNGIKRFRVSGKPDGNAVNTYVLAVILIEVSDVFYNSIVAELFERLLPSKSQYFPQQDSERPHITLAREFVLNQEYINSSKSGGLRKMCFTMLFSSFLITFCGLMC